MKRTIFPFFTGLMKWSLNLSTPSRIVALAAVTLLVLNLITGALMPLHSDEVYFWTYHWHLDWGYWDHAPMIGWLNYLGQALFPYQELGVRLFPVLLNAVSLWILWKLTDQEDAWLFLAMLLGVFLFQMAGLIAAPDSPLAFFNCLLLLAFSCFLKQPGWKEAIILGITAALVLYSKYHGFMLIGMLALSVPRMWLRWTFWLALATTAILFYPGFAWLAEHDFATFNYHLLNRNPEPWTIRWTLEFLAGQLLVAGPLMSFILFPALFLYPPQTPFEKSLRISVFGILGFLLIASFRMTILANWSASAFPPLILLGYAFVRSRPAWKNWTMRLGVASIILFLLARIYFLAGLPLPKEQELLYRGWSEWAVELEKRVGDHPTVFQNSYQRPSRFAFETKRRNVFNASNFYYHPTQYDLWPIEDSLQGKKVFYVSSYRAHACDSFQISNGRKTWFCPIDDFRSFQRVRVAAVDLPQTVEAGSTVDLTYKMYHPEGKPVLFSQSTSYTFFPSYHIRQQSKFPFRHKLLTSLPLADIPAGDTVRIQVPITFPEEAGEYEILVNIGKEWLFPNFGKQGSWERILVE